MRLLFLASACAFAATAAYADILKQPDDHAPIGIMGDHLHKKGEWMIGYKYKSSTTRGMRDGDSRVSNASVMAAYGEIPANMEMGMHMAEVMYGITDDLTLMVMPQYMQMRMLHMSSHGGGHSHTHEVEGFGDTEVTGLYSLYRDTNNRAHLNIGVNLPTGATDKTFTDHHGKMYHLPYNMQFGSGTFDPILGATWVGKSADWSWGAQTMNYIRVGNNNEGYRQGNRYSLTGWAARNLTKVASTSLRFEGEAWGNVNGRDATLPLNIMAGADPSKQSGQRVMAYIGLNLLAGEGTFSGNRLALEFGLPAYERTNGPQPDSDYRLTVGWQKAF